MSWLADAFGLGAPTPELSAGEVVLRAMLVYGFTLACVRLGHKRMLNRGTAFDVVLAIMVGSVASRSINGSAPLLPTLAGIAMLIALHWATAALAYVSPRAGLVVKGKPRILVERGELRRDEMRRSHVTEHDIEEALRRRGLQRLEQTEQVTLERDGELSVVTREPS